VAVARLAPALLFVEPYRLRTRALARICAGGDLQSIVLPRPHRITKEDIFFEEGSSWQISRVQVRVQTRVWLIYAYLCQSTDKKPLGSLRHYAQLRLFIIDLLYSRETQNPPRATSWGFNPPSRHHLSY